MDAEKIIQDLNRRFAKPLPEFYKRRIVVWYDEDREFEDKLDSIQVNGVKLLALNGSNSFYVKKLLAVDDPLAAAWPHPLQAERQHQRGHHDAPAVDAGVILQKVFGRRAQPVHQLHGVAMLHHC